MKKNISFLYLFILSFIFRFVFLQKLFFFGMDQEYEVYLAQKILSLENFPLIGVNASDTGIYLGPFFIYLTAIVLKVFSQDPLGFAVFASGAGVVSTLLTYLVFKSVFGQKTGFFTAIIHAVSYLAVFYDRQYWNVTGIYILGILLFFYRLFLYEKRAGSIPIPFFFFSCLVFQCSSFSFYLPASFSLFISQNDEYAWF